MNKRINAGISFMVAGYLVVFAAQAQNKVVVIPLGAEAAVMAPAAPVAQLVGGASVSNGFGDGSSNFMPMGASQRSVDYDVSKMRIASSGTITQFFAGMAVVTTQGSYTITFVLNGADQSLSCNANTGIGTTTCTDLSSCVNVAVGDDVAVKFVGLGDPASNAARWNGLFTPGGVCPVE